MEIKRDKYLNKLISKKENGLVKVITGLRRSGKSYLLFELYYNYLKSIGIQEEQIIKLKLDDDSNIKYRNPLELGQYLRSLTNDKTKKYYVFIDEIQFVQKIKNPYSEENNLEDYITFYEVLNGLLNQKNVDIYVTGSNSRMLSKDILTQFRGRGDQIHIYPLSFKEYYSIENKDFDEAYEEYQLFGGLPFQTLLKKDEDKINYLKNLFKETYLRDIIDRNNVQDEEAINKLIDVLSSSIGSYTNATKIEKTFLSESKIKYNHKTIAKHIEYLLDAFIINEAKRYDIKGRKYIGANSKYYFSDIGLRNAKLNFRQNESTHIMENIIYNELLIREFNVDIGIVEIIEKNNDKSTRKQLEVDFIANKGMKKYYIQSVYDMSSFEKQKNEKKSLLNINDSFKKIIIVNGKFKPWNDENGFLIISLKDFLLKDDSLDF